MATKGIVIQITGDGASAAKALELVDAHLKQTANVGKQGATEISEAMSKIESALSMVGITVGIGEAINAMREMVTSSLEFGEAIERAGQKTGLAAGTLSTLHYAAAVTGGDFDSMTSAVAKMDKTIGQATEGNKPALAFMKSLGLNATELAGRQDGAEVAFRKFTQTLAATENPIRRVELATAVLGKAGASQIPMLIDVGNHWDEYKQKAMDAGVYLDGAGAASLEETNRKLNDMKQHLAGASLQFTEGITPSIVAMISTIEGGRSQMQTMQDFGSIVGRTLSAGGMAVYGFASGVEHLVQVFDELKRVQADGDLDFASADHWKELGRQASVAAEEMNTKSMGMRDLMLGNTKPPAATGLGNSGPDSTRRRNDAGGFGGTDLGGGGRGGRDASTRAVAEVGPPIDNTRVEGDRRGAQKAQRELQAFKDSQNEAPAPMPNVISDLGLAKFEQEKTQTEALQALDLKGDTIKRESGLADTQIQQQALTGTLSQHAALEQLNSEHAAEIVRLQALAAEYAAFGDVGRDAYVKIEEEITRTMAETQKQDKKGEDPAVKALGDGITSMAEKMAQATGKGRQGFHAMAMSMEQDLVELAVKFAAQRWLAPFMNSLGTSMSGGGGGFNSGGAGNGAANIAAFAGGGDFPGGSPMLVGEHGPELAFPSGPGTIMPNDALQNLSRSSGGGGAPNMTMNVTNASSQPVTARQTGSSFDADTRSYFTHVILEDLSQGGPISSALRPGG